MCTVWCVYQITPFRNDLACCFTNTIHNCKMFVGKYVHLLVSLHKYCTFDKRRSFRGVSANIFVGQWSSLKYHFTEFSMQYQVFSYQKYTLYIYCSLFHVCKMCIVSYNDFGAISKCKLMIFWKSHRRYIHTVHVWNVRMNQKSWPKFIHTNAIRFHACVCVVWV